MNFDKILWVTLGIILLLQDLIKVIFSKEYLIYLDEIAFLIIFFIIITKKLLKKKIYFDKVSIFALVLFIYGIILEIFNLDLKTKTFIYLLYILKFYFIYLLGQNLEINKYDLLDILNFFGKIFLIYGFIGLINFFLGGRLLKKLGYETYTRYGFYRIHSLFTHPMQMGWFAAIFLGYFIFRYLLVRKDKRLIVYAIFSFIIMILTNCRKSWVGFLSAFIVLCLFLLRKKISLRTKKVIFLILFFIIPLLLILSLPFTLNILSITKTQYLESDSVARLLLYQTSFQIMHDYFPFGSGIATFGSVGSLRPYSEIYYKYGLAQIFGLSPWHTSFILDTFWASIFGELGAIGTIIYLLTFIFIINKLRNCFKNCKNNEEQFLVIFSLFLFFEGIIESIVAGVFVYFLNLYFIFGISSITIKLISNKKKNISKDMRG